MKIGAIIWGGTALNCLIRAAVGLKDVELTAFSPRQLEDSEQEKKCFASLRECGAVLLYTANNETWERIKPVIKEMAKTRAVICMSMDPGFLKCSSVKAKVVKTCYEYLLSGGEENFANMLRFIGNEVAGLDLAVEPPRSLPWEGIVDADTGRVYPGLEDYYRAHGRKEGPAVGILFYRCYWVNRNMEIERALVKELERRGLNVIPAFSQSIGRTESGSMTGYEVVKEFFLDAGGRPVIDAFINLQSSLLSPGTDGSGNPGIEGGAEFLKKMDIPVFHPLIAYSKTEAEWREDKLGLGSSAAWQITMPEFQGVIEPVIIGATERVIDEKSGACVERYRPLDERVERFAARVENWIALKRTPPDKRKIAVILHNNPCASVEATVGCGAHLDTLESAARILKEMKNRGYAVAPPENGRELISVIMERKAVSEFRWTTTEEIVKKGGVLSFISKEEYLEWFNTFPEKVKDSLCRTWGKPPGEEKDGVPAAMVYRDKILVTGVSFGNAVVCVQPKRGCAGARCDGKVCRILHDPEIPPPHQYLATYRFLENGFKADLIVHVGTHGNVEFLPGKGSGLSGECYPDISLGRMPHLYIYNADNPAEGIIAKRRSYAVLVDHMQTVMIPGGLYDELEELAGLLSEYDRAKDTDRIRAHTLEHMIKDKIKEANLGGEIDTAPGARFAGIVKKAHEVLTRLKTTLIPDGMHIFGENPAAGAKTEFINSILRYDFADGLSSRKIIFELLGVNMDSALSKPSVFSKTRGKTHSEIIEEADGLSLRLIGAFLEDGEKAPALHAKEILGDSLKNAGALRKLSFLRKKALDIAESIDASDEMGALFQGKSAGFIEPGPSGLITRGRPDVLPTGRNFYSLDPKKIPTQAAWKVGQRLAAALIDKYKKDTGRFPENPAMVWFCSDIMWADGEEMAQLMSLIGVRPVWHSNGRVKGFEVIPLKELGRPRIDVTVRLSGITRDCFPECVDLLDEAVQAAALLPEAPEDNFIRKHILERTGTLDMDGTSPEFREATFRMFGSRPGTYGSGVNLAIYASAWKEEKDLSEVFVYWNGYAYGKGVPGKESYRHFTDQLKSVDLTFNKSVTDEYDLFGCCCYFSTQGGMSLTAKHVSGKEIKNYYGDTRDPSRVRVDDLADEVRRIVRTKLLNPRWIEGMKRHGYKGAADISKRVGRVYGWEATTGEVDDWIFDDIARTFVLDKQMREFFRENNPWAMEEIGRRLLEAQQRELWDADPEVLEGLKNVYLEIESWFEEKMGDAGGDFQGGSVDVLTSGDVEAWNEKMSAVRSIMSSAKPGRAAGIKKIKELPK